MPAFHKIFRHAPTASLLLLAFACAGCGDSRAKVFDVESDPVSTEEREELRVRKRRRSVRQESFARPLAGRPSGQ